MEIFEEILRKDLHQLLLSMKEVDERLQVGDGTSGMRLPDCPDVEEKCFGAAMQLNRMGYHMTKMN